MILEKYTKGQAVIFNKTVDGKYKVGDTGIVDDVLAGDSYNVKSAGTIINSVPQDDITLAYTDKSNTVDQILREREKGNEFKDSDIRVGGSRKEMMAFKGLMTSADLDDIEKDAVTARKLINKQKVYPEVNIEEEKQNGATSGVIYLKVKLREACGANPPDSPQARALYVGYISAMVNALSGVKTANHFREITRSLAYNNLREMILIANPALEQEINQEESDLKGHVEKVNEYERKADSIYNALKDKYGLFWTSEYKNSQLEGSDKELADQYYYWKDLHKTVMRYKNYHVLPVEIAFAQKYSKKALGDYQRESKWICRESVQQIFGVTFSNFLTVKTEAVEEKYRDAFKYSAITEEDYAPIYINNILPVEERIVKYETWITNLRDSEKSYKEKVDYALNEIKMASYWISNVGNFTQKITFEKLIEKNDHNGVMDFINIMANNPTVGFARNIQYQKALLETLKDQYKIRADDFSWANPKETKKIERKSDLQINSGVPLSYIKRVGGVAVFDNDLDTGDKVLSFYKSTLGITGVTYGQTLPDNERSAHAKHFAGAILDLAELLNWNTQDLIGLGGLKILFAASGHGRAMAHFDPARNSVNLTRKSGDGTVAHEMAHYFDKAIENMFPNERKSKERHAPYGSFFSAINLSNVEIYKAMKALMHFIKYGVPLNSNGQISAIQDKKIFNMGVVFPYLSKELNDELFPLIEDFVKEVVKKEITIEVKKSDTHTLRGTYLNFEDALHQTKLKYPYYFHYVEYMSNKAVKQYLAALLNTFNIDKYDFVFTNIPFKRTDYGAKNTSTAFMINSSEMSSQYWTFDWELFARGFETFIAYRQMKIERENNYLVSGAFFDRPEGVYPVGLERDILYILYDNLFNVIKKEVGIKDFVPFREERSNEYIVLGENDTENRKVVTDVLPEMVFDPIAEAEAKERLRTRWGNIANKLAKKDIFEDGGDIEGNENVDVISNLFHFSNPD